MSMFKILCVADFESYEGDDFLKRIQLLCKAGVDEILLRAAAARDRVDRK